MTISNEFDLDEISESQSDKYLTHNESNRQLGAGIAGVFEYDFASNPSSYTLSTTAGSEEWRYRIMRFTDNGSPQLTSETSIIFPAAKNPPIVQIKNDTAVNLRAITDASPSSGVIIPPGEVRSVYKNPETDDMDYADNMGRVYNTASYDVASDSNHTLPDDTAGQFAIYVNDNSPTLTTDRTLTLAAGEYPGIHFVYNSSAYTLTFKYSGDVGPGVAIPPDCGHFIVNAGPAFGLSFYAASINHIFNGQFTNVWSRSGTGSPDEYTLVVNDQGSFLKVDADRLVVPPNSSVDFPVRTAICGRNVSATKTLTITAGAGVTINSPGGLVDIADQHGQFSLVYEGSDVWSLEGRLS